MKTVILKMGFIFLFLALTGAGCEDNDDNQYEKIPLTNFECPCDHETDFIKEVTMQDVLLFDAAKTSYPNMKELSFDGTEAIFVSHSYESDSTIFYSFRGTSTDMGYLDIGYICNFPEVAKKWTIPSQGIYISFTAKVFHACHGHPSVGFTTYTDNILTSLKRKIQ